VPREARRQAILDAALKLFSERGFHGAAVPSIAEEAGVGAGTVYRNFESKEHLVNELYRTWKIRLAEFLLAQWPHCASPREQIAHVWRRALEFAAEHPTAVSFTELHHHADYLDDESRALQAALHQRFVDLIVELQKARALRDDVDPDGIIAVFEGVFMRLRHEAERNAEAVDERVLEQAERCIWEAVRA
jgi:TetR/AcrR family transcriptional regulator, repressor of fatR-cypB operon